MLRILLIILLLNNIAFGAEIPTKEKPNIIIIMLDDMGYSDIGSYGSEINTPNIDQLAKEGVRFTQFYNASVCCPSRASLLTGLYPHQAGVGYMDNDWGYESYQGRIKHGVFTLAEMLSQAGYSTIMSGKWHLGTRKGDNPWERGFEQFYGIPNGGGVYFLPTTLDRDVITYNKEDGKGPVKLQPDTASFYSTDAFTDYAIDQLNSERRNDKPFFMYLAYIAPHYPQQAKEQDIQKYIGKYKKGWDALRKERYARQLQLGIATSKHPLSPSEGLNWDILSEEDKVKLDRQMAAYAAQLDIVDQNIGRLLRTLKSNGMEENTIVIFLSDNGAQKNADMGFEKNPGALFGSKQSFGGYAKGWANLSNTPFKKFKLEEYNGGNSTPFIVRWPAVLKNAGAISRQIAHISDIVPTCLAAANLNTKEIFLRSKGQKFEGINLMPYLKDPNLEIERKLYWEHKGNKAVLHGNWKLVASFKEDWQLYNVANDKTELTDLSLLFPDKKAQLIKNYSSWAQRAGVLPWPVKKN